MTDSKEDQENFSSQVGVRLREVRDGLGLSQASFAEMIQVSREQLGRYERGAGMPGGEVLGRLARKGADILYVLTGRPVLPLKTGRNPLLLAKCVDAINQGMRSKQIELDDEHRGRAYFGLYDLATGAGGLSESLIAATLDLLPVRQK